MSGGEDAAWGACLHINFQTLLQGWGRGRGAFLDLEERHASEPEVRKPLLKRLGELRNCSTKAGNEIKYTSSTALGMNVAGVG